MDKFLRFAGAQIPCTNDIKLNIQSIKDAIDWAVSNNVDYLITPEGSLSGYFNEFDTYDLKEGLLTIEKYAANKVALCLGTLWVEGDHVKRNQIRFYNKDGTYNTAINKTIITPHDIDIGINLADNFYVVEMPDCKNEYGNSLIAGAFICNDFYGRPQFPDLTRMAFQDGAKIFLHSTNADRGVSKVYDQVMDDWHTAHLQMISFLAKIPVVTVDNCCGMAGGAFDGPTSSQSGVLIAGEWVVKVPRYNTQYFYYDFPLDNLFAIDWPSKNTN